MDHGDIEFSCLMLFRDNHMGVSQNRGPLGTGRDIFGLHRAFGVPTGDCIGSLLGNSQITACVVYAAFLFAAGRRHTADKWLALTQRSSGSQGIRRSWVIACFLQPVET